VSAQRLNAKKTRDLARITGLPILRAWAHGGYTFDFVTAGHLHGWYDTKSKEWGIYESQDEHYNTCSPTRPQAGQDPLFPDGVPPLTEAERNAMSRQ
jgi:hypothetical protein